MNVDSTSLLPSAAMQVPPGQDIRAVSVYMNRVLDDPPPDCIEQLYTTLLAQEREQPGSVSPKDLEKIGRLAKNKTK